MTAAVLIAAGGVVCLCWGFVAGSCWEAVRPGGSQDQADDAEHARQQLRAYRLARRPLALTPGEQAQMEQLESAWRAS